MDLGASTVAFTLDVLKFLAHFVGNWGVAIIILTLIVRLLMWPSSVTQQRSMRQMQKFQPKMKEIQDRYKSNPEQMQKKMAEFYKEHNFNPFSGCLPLLIQLPVFILLYSALMSPQFIADAGKANFLFIKRLDATIKSNAGVSYDGSFGVGKFSKFATGKNAIVVIKTEDGKEEELDNVKVPEPLKSVSVQGEITPGKPLDLKIPLEQLKLGFSQLNKVQKADFDIINTETKETEKISFKRSGDNLVATVPTIEVASNIHYDVIALVILFAITMWLSQKIMMATGNNASQQDPTTAAMQKTMGTLMPIMICGTFFFIPIPAGVLLYLLTSNIFQIAQTVVINKQLDLEEEKKKTAAETTIDNDAVNDAKQIKAKD